MSLILIMLAISSPSEAHDYKAGKLEIKHPVISAVPPGASVAAGYFAIINDSDSEDRLVDVIASFAEEVEIHQVVFDTDVAGMHTLEDGLLLPAKSTVSLTRGHMHLMFEKLNEQLVLGELYDVTLVFEHAGERTVQFWVQNIAGQSPHLHEQH